MLAVNKENDLLTHGPHKGKMNAKTPGPPKLHPKTPFKIPLNDENVEAKTAKKGLFGGKDPSLFVTPVGPRGGSRRPALTGKTTNAKARKSTPYGEITGDKKPAASATRAGLSSVSVSVGVHDGQEDYPEIEYMPSCPPELPDIPDDFLVPDYGRLSKNIYRDCHRQFVFDVDEFGKTNVERQLEECERQVNAMLDAETEELLNPRAVQQKDSRSKKSDSTSATHGGKRAAGGISTRQSGDKRPASSSTSRPASVLSTTSSVSSRTGPPTSASVKAATLLSQRPASSASNSRSQVPAKVTRHTRSISTSIINKPLGSSRSSKPPQFSSRPENRVRSLVNSRSTIGYANGKGVGREVRKILSTAPKETAIEACERILREDEENFGPIILPPVTIDAGTEDEELVAPPVDDDEEFYMQLPE